MADDQSIPIPTDDSPSVILELIYNMKIKDVMTTALITAKRTDTLRHIQSVMRENYITGIPIAEDLRLLGIVSMDDINKRPGQGLHRRHCGAAHDPQRHRPGRRHAAVLRRFLPEQVPVRALSVLNKNRELVGIITSKDVIKTLLVEMNREVLRLERAQTKQRGDCLPDGVSELLFRTTRYDFEGAGHASTEIKKTLKKLELDPKLIRRIAVASYELEINQVVHSYGGSIRCEIREDRVTITAEDTGPGIADVDLALQEGWSTANEWIRSLGFGAGMGLTNTKRVSDEFEIESVVGTGTTVKSTIFIREEAAT
jgi:anti-sigma regulatory factor (Ser/Thr protein kinase)